jgi:single-stranded DNA-binding protein
MEMAEFLEEFYDGGKILIVAGSAQQNIIMQASGIR